MGFLLSHEIQRKAFHLSGSLIPIIYYFLNKETALIALFFVNLILFTIEYLRLKGKINLPKNLMRRHEKNQIAGYVYFQMSAFISILFFEKTIAIASILMLAFGDAASGITGALIKGSDVRNSNNISKPFPIMVIMFIVCLFVGIILLNIPLASDMKELNFWVYVSGAFGATLGDSVHFKIFGKSIDDNFTIPLLSGTFMSAFFFIISTIIK